MSADIDIDTKTSFDPRKIFPWVKASMVRNQKLVPHPCGVHPQKIPVDCVTGLAAIPYEAAAENGFDKIDFLHLNVYDHFDSREDIEALLELEPDWELLLKPKVQEKLFQLAKHGAILDHVRPRSIAELADVLALIRPGRTELVKLYKMDRMKVQQLLYAKQGVGGYTFKKAHAFAYAQVVILQLHLISIGVI